MIARKDQNPRVGRLWNRFKVHLGVLMRIANPEPPLLMVARLEVLQVATTVRLAPSQRVTKMIVNRGPGLREMMETVRRGVNPPGKAAIARTDQPREEKMQTVSRGAVLPGKAAIARTDQLRQEMQTVSREVVLPRKAAISNAKTDQLQEARIK